MLPDDPFPGPVLRWFEARAKPGRGDDLAKKFATTSVDVVRDQAGNIGHFHGREVAGHGDVLVFASVWTSLDAIKERFGDAWQSSYLPAGYDDLIAECSVRHFDLASGWPQP
ncbi:MAG: hypothetical protein OXR84_16270 [Magnetovibrio sp.]|nr:hypothetical protein [Magnetovibrio sp.]